MPPLPKSCPILLSQGIGRGRVAPHCGAVLLCCVVLTLWSGGKLSKRQYDLAVVRRVLRAREAIAPLRRSSRRRSDIWGAASWNLAPGERVSQSIERSAERAREGAVPSRYPGRQPAGSRASTGAGVSSITPSRDTPVNRRLRVCSPRLQGAARCTRRRLHYRSCWTERASRSDPAADRFGRIGAVLTEVPPS
jgi:hypothetical protein